jgi:AbrB family looped-hinge helix DNA binding protein
MMKARTTINADGRLLLPKRVREQLGLAPGMEVELDAVDGRLEVTLPTRAKIEEGPRGPRLTADTSQRLTTEQVRDPIEGGRGGPHTR